MSREAERLAKAWIEAWERGVPDELPLANNFVHTSPYGRLEGRATYLDTVRPIAAANVVTLRIEDVVGSGDRACIRYAMETANGPVACCDWVVISGNEITSVQSYYDPREIPSNEAYADE